MRSRSVTDENLSSSWDAHPATKSMACRSLRTLRQSSEPSEANPWQRSDRNGKQIGHGRKLIVELGCASCHEINGVQKPENFAPELSTIGSKPLAQIRSEWEADRSRTKTYRRVGMRILPRNQWRAEA